VELTLDAELLLEAQRQISAESADAAVNEALRRLVDEERAKRDAARARLQQMYDDGELDFHPLDELDQ
jgi:Arc/MetJ family transcription regulator